MENSRNQLRGRIFCLGATAWEVGFEVVRQGFFQMARGKKEGWKGQNNHQDSGEMSCLGTRWQCGCQERCVGMNWCSQVISTPS